MPTNVTIYHNPRCSKSRAALEYLKQQDCEITVIEYLKQPPSVSTIESLLGLLGMQPAELVRRSEAPYKALNLANSDEQTLITAMSENPILIERPVVATSDCAVIGRPLDHVIQMLDDHD